METGLTFGCLRYTEIRSNRIFVTVECLYGFKVALRDGVKRIVRPAPAPHGGNNIGGCMSPAAGNGNGAKLFGCGAVRRS